MCNKLKNNTHQSGYTLIEMAITMIIIGILATPAIALYHQYKIKDDYEKTGNSIAEAVSALGDYRAAYGRYPCPSPATAAPGSALYGLEDCAASASETSDRSGMGDIVIGSLPFKTMNLQEYDIFDSYGYRLTYAVTESMTDAATFNAANGGITILDKAGNQLLTPVDSGQFIVLSHGQNTSGGFTRTGGLRSPCAGDPSEIENCDDDSIFTVGLKDNAFDDRAKYFASEELSEWQIQSTTSQDIYMKNLRDMAIGVFTSSDLSTAEQAAVRTTTTDTGGVTANNFNFQSNSICEFGESINTGDCFNPGLLTENHAPGTGLVCPDATPYLTGISNGTPVCTDQITVGCPAGMFMAGLNAGKQPVCRGIPPDGCPAQDVTTTCGESRTLTARDHDQYELIYSGQCHSFPATHDTAFFAAGTAGLNSGQINTWLNTLNADDRVQSACGSTASAALVRDSYLCQNGTWNYQRAHERLTAGWPSFPSNPSLNSSYQNAENNIPYTTTVDPHNNSSNHDCWCREDYRVTTPPCPGGLTGTGIRIQKYRCPQTNSSWKDYTTVYEDFSSCTCAPEVRQTNVSCLSYYNFRNGTSHTGGLTGNVAIQNNFKCNALNALEIEEPPISIDTSSCACPANDPIINRTACDPGYTNSFSWTLGGTTYNETGIEAITTQTFVCPGTTDGIGIPTPGAYTSESPVPSIPACSCDNTYFEDRLESCPANKEGTGITRRYVMNCVTGQMEDSGVVVSDECHDCTWNAGNPGEDNDNKLGGGLKEVGRKCNCGAPASPVCWAEGGSSKAYKTFTNCPCVIDLN